MTNDCRICTRPTDAFACDDCGDGYAKDLKALVDWLHEDLEVSVSGAKGVQYRAGVTSGGGDVGLSVNWRAAALYRRLHLALSMTVDHCVKVGTKHSSTTEAAPPVTISAMALWLTWRVDGLCLDPEGPRLIAETVTLVERATELVFWVPPERRFLGPCDLCGEGMVYAEGEAEEAYCNRCEAAFPAEVRRAALIAKLDDRLATAAEIGDLSAHLGLRKDRERVRKSVNTWHHRKVIEAKGQDDKGKAKFRVGDVWRRLVADDEQVVSKTTAR